MNPSTRLLLLWIAIVLAAAACGSNDSASLIASAKDYIAKRDYNASIIQLKNALQKEPENAEARYLLGLASLEKGDLVRIIKQQKKHHQSFHDYDGFCTPVQWDADEKILYIPTGVT